MGEGSRILSEVFFNLIYLAIVIVLIVKMISRFSRVSSGNRKAAGCLLLAFGLLTGGDLIHLGFRIAGFAMGTLEKYYTFMGMELNPVGIGALITGITFTLFYVAMLFLWRARFGKPFGLTGFLLLLIALVRFVIMLSSANEWNSSTHPQPWFAYRTFPLVLQQAGMAYLMLRESKLTGDVCFRWIGIMMVVSFLFLLPIAFYIHAFPLLGMLMIPKTVTYIVMAFLGFSALYRKDKLCEQ
jgi:hypothetical protein